MVPQMVKEVVPFPERQFAIRPLTFHYKQVPLSPQVLISEEAKLGCIWYVVL